MRRAVSRVKVGGGGDFPSTSSTHTTTYNQMNKQLTPTYIQPTMHTKVHIPPNTYLVTTIITQVAPKLKTVNQIVAGSESLPHTHTNTHTNTHTSTEVVITTSRNIYVGMHWWLVMLHLTNSYAATSRQATSNPSPTCEFPRRLMVV